MKSERPFRVRLIHYLFWTLGVLLLFCIEPTYILLKEKWIIESAVRNAKSIQVIHYNPYFHPGEPEMIYDTKELKPQEFDQVSGAFPVCLDIGFPGIETSCLFSPHHRIVMKDKEGHETVIRVCFICDHFAIGDSEGEIFATPFAWRPALRHFFEKEGQPFRPDRYMEDRQQYWKTHPLP